jgi:hypothetical protein
MRETDRPATRDATRWKQGWRRAPSRRAVTADRAASRRAGGAAEFFSVSPARLAEKISLRDGASVPTVSDRPIEGACADMYIHDL